MGAPFLVSAQHTGVAGQVNREVAGFLKPDSSLSLVHGSGICAIHIH